MQFRIRPSIAFLAVLTAWLWALPVQATDMDTVQSRELADILSSVPSASAVRGYQSTMQSNGSWTDVNYADTSSTNWTPLTHVDRMLSMAQAYYSSSSSLYHNAPLKTDMLKAYDYWVTTDPKSANWWYNQIGSPQPFSNAMLLMENDLSASQITSGMTILNRSTTTGYTGANLTDQAAVIIRKGLINNSSATVASGFSSVGASIVITTAEGIQRDYSYHQHGAQLQSGGSYSWVYDEGITSIGPFAAGTQYAFTDTQIHTFVDYMLDGGQWFVRGQASDYTSLGRAVSRSGASSAGQGFTGHIAAALTMNNGYRSAELQTFLDRQNDTAAHGSASLNLDFTGNKAFWESDIMIQHRPAYYASVKTSSTRTLQPESGNAEGLTNLYLADGVTQIMRTGNEYDDIMPVWNWRRLPGITVEQDSRSLKPASDWGVAGTATYSGGVSDGIYGASGFNYSRYHVAAKKSTFFFDNELVALGSAINASASTSNVNTTLNQSRLNGTVSYKTTGSPTVQMLTTGTVTPTNLSWVFHDGVGYFFPTPVSNATILAQSQSGSWYAINNTQSSTTVSKNVFTLYLNHGTAFTGGSYAYIVVPGITAASMDAYLAANPINVLANTSNIQAIRQSSLDMTQATFYATGTSTITPTSGQTIAVNGKSMIMVRPQVNSYEVCAASPESAQMSLNVTLSGVKPASAPASWFDAMGNSVLTYALPGGDMAGSTAVAKIVSDGDANPTVTVTSGSATSLTYAVNATVALPGNTAFTTDTDTTLNLNNPVTGAYALTFSGGTLNLAGANTYSGLTTLTTGTANVSGDQSAAPGGWRIGPGNNIATTVNFAAGATVVVAPGKSIALGNTVASGTLATVLNVAGTVTNQGALAVNRASTLNLNNGAIWTQSGDLSLGPPAGSGYSSAMVINAGASLVYSGSSPIHFAPAQSNSGNATLTIAGGTLSTSRGFNNPVTTSTGAATLTLNSAGKIVATADIAQLTSGTIALTLGTGGGIIDTGTYSVALAGNIGGSGALTKRGPGTLVLSGSNTYAAATVIASGTLQMGAGGTTGNVGTGTITNNGTLAVNRSNAVSIGVVISGTGGVSQLGSGTTTLAGLNTYTGATTVQSGALRITADYLPATPAPADVSGTGVLVFDHSRAQFTRVRGTNLSITNQSILQIAPSGQDTGVSIVSGALTLDSTSRIDLQNNTLILNASAQFNGVPLSVANLRAAVIAGRGAVGTGGATWSGSGGLGSSSFTLESVNSLGYIWNGDPNLLILGGVDSVNNMALSNTDYAVKFTRAGDANLDGVVDNIDVGILGLRYQTPLGNQWYQGDFNYDGVVNNDDVAILGLAYSPAALPLSAGFRAPLGDVFAATSIIPEPAALSLLAVAILLHQRRRRLPGRGDPRCQVLR